MCHGERAQSCPFICRRTFGGPMTSFSESLSLVILSSITHALSIPENIPAKQSRSIEIFIRRFSRNFASRGRVSRERLVPRGNFIKRPAPRSPPFIYGNPLSNAVGGSETSLDLALPPAAYGRGKPLPLDVRVSTRPI